MLCVEQTCTVCGGRCLHIRGYIGCFIQSRLNQCALTEMRRCHVVRISKTTKLTSFRRPYCLHCIKAKLPQSFFEICYVLYLNKTWIIYVFKKSLTTKRSTIIVTNISKNYQNLSRMQIVLLIIFKHLLAIPSRNFNSISCTIVMSVVQMNYTTCISKAVEEKNKLNVRYK